jgi:superfamily I DNA/RNA helicase
MTTVHLMQAFPPSRAVSLAVPHVLVDEYQDTNHAQHASIS